MTRTPSGRRRASHLFALHLAASGALLLGGAGLSGSAYAQAARQYAIPSGPLGATLTRFAAEAGVVLSFAPAAVAGKTSPGLNGSYSAEDGLRALLRGSGQQLEKTAAGYTLALAPSAPAAAQEATLGEVTVLAQAGQESAWGPVIGYAARRSAAGTKTDTPLLETPQAVSVVTADQMAVLKVQSLGDALAYTPGVIAVAGYSKSYDNFVSRGFALRDDSGSLVRDGLKLGGSGWASGQQEPYGLERVELLKGAASVLYGASAPGGVLNTVSKRPGPDMLREVRAGIGNLGHREAAFDLGGAVAPDSAWSWRLTGLARNGDTHIDHIPSNGRYIAPAATWRPDAATSLTLLGYHQERRTAYYYPLPAEGTLVASRYGQLPRQRFVGEPDFDREDTRQSAFGWLFEHAFSDTVKLRHGLRWIKSSNRVRFTGMDGWVDEAAPRAQYRTAYDELETTSGLSTDTSVEYRVQTGAVAHTLLVGLDASRLRPHSQWSMATLAPLDLYAPVYGAQPGPMTLVPSYSQQTVQTRKGLYAQDQMKFGQRWVLLLGGRQDWTRDAASPLFGTPAWTTQSDSAFTGRAGGVYLADGGLAPFVSFSQSFQPQAGSDQSGKRFKPTEGEQAEFGVRWQLSPEGVLLSASAYELTQQNVVTRDPAQPQLRRQLGEVRARGVELEAKGRIGRHLNLIASYAYTDARTTKSLNPAEVGKRTEYVPYHQASVWADGELGGGFQAGLGARHVGSYADVNGTGAGVPAVNVVDAMLGYRTGPWLLALNFSNLGNKQALACASGSCNYGEGRRASASLAYRW